MRIFGDAYIHLTPVHSPHLPVPLPPTTLLLLLVMISFAGFGKSKKTQEMTAAFSLKNALSCGTSVRHTPVRTLEGSSFPSPRIHRQNPLENPDPMPSEDSSRWNAPCIRIKGSILRVFCCDGGVFQDATRRAHPCS